MDPAHKLLLGRVSRVCGILLLMLGIWSKVTDHSIQLTVLSLSFGIILLFLPLIFWTYREGEGLQADF